MKDIKFKSVTFENDDGTWNTFYRHFVIRDGEPSTGTDEVYPFVVSLNGDALKEDLDEARERFRAGETSMLVVKQVEVEVIEISKRDALETVCDWIDCYLYDGKADIERSLDGRANTMPVKTEPLRTRRESRP